MKYALNSTINGKEIKRIRESLKLSRADFCSFINVSKRTLEGWETSEKEIVGPVVTLLAVLYDDPMLENNYRIPDMTESRRMYYMYKNKICTVIDYDDFTKVVMIKNFTDKLQFRAFGINETPNYEDFQAFLESRCFPRERDKMKIILQELSLPFYDPYLIIKKTQGKMAEDDFWIKLEENK